MAAVSLFWETIMAVVTSCENTQTRPTKADKGKIKIKVETYINISTSEGNVTFFYLYTLPGKNLPLSIFQQHRPLP